MRFYSRRPWGLCGKHLTTWPSSGFSLLSIASSCRATLKPEESEAQVCILFHVASVHLTWTSTDPDSSCAFTKNYSRISTGESLLHPPVNEWVITISPGNWSGPDLICFYLGFRLPLQAHKPALLISWKAFCIQRRAEPVIDRQPCSPLRLFHWLLCAYSKKKKKKKNQKEC